MALFQTMRRAVPAMLTRVLDPRPILARTEVPAVLQPTVTNHSSPDHSSPDLVTKSSGNLPALAEQTTAAGGQILLPPRAFDFSVIYNHLIYSIPLFFALIIYREHRTSPP